MLSADSNFYINNEVNAKLPSLVFAMFPDIKDFALGEDYELSVNIVSEDRIKELNKEYRKIDKATDILSFPVSEKVGEIFINLEQTAIEAKKFDREFDNFLAFLFIHGLVHLNGFDHGSKMDSIEKGIREYFGI